MKFTIIIKQIISALIYKARIADKKISNLSKLKYLILMYHRVLPKSEINKKIQSGMYVEAATFDKQIRYLKENFEIKRLSDVSDFRFKSFELDMPICILTFDDGWYDFYQTAFPILKKYNVPATVFLPTEYINSNRWFWTDQLSQLLYEKNKNRKLNRIYFNEIAGKILMP